MGKDNRLDDSLFWLFGLMAFCLFLPVAGGVEIAKKGSGVSPLVLLRFFAFAVLSGLISTGLFLNWHLQWILIPAGVLIFLAGVWTGRAIGAR